MSIHNNNSNSDLQVTNSMMNSMAECFTLQHSLLSVPFFDGKNVPLRDFLQDVINGSAYIPPASEGAYVKAVLGKLKGTARDSTFGKTFNTVNDLIKHLKKIFAPGKDYPYYQHEIENIKMKRGESVNDFYDRLNILISGAKVALEDMHGKQLDEVMLIPIKACALEAFIRGLPDEYAGAVDMREPETLEEALKHAVRIETRKNSGISLSETTPKTILQSPSSSYQNYSSFDPLNYTAYPDSSNYNRNVRAYNLTQSRPSSPLPSGSAPSHQNFVPPFPFPFPYPFPYCYPPLPNYYPNNYPLQFYDPRQHQSFRNRSESDRLGSRSPSPVRSPLPRSNSPNKPSLQSKNLDSRENLNSWTTRRNDAAASQSSKPR